MSLDSDWIKSAVKIVKDGLADKLCKDNVTVYKCGSNIIRIDINTKEGC